MALFNRERDFTTSTMTTIRENLRGETEEFREFQKFLDEYGDAFDNREYHSDLLEMDSALSELRILMSETTPKALDKIEQDVHAADEKFAVKCRETAADIESYRNKVESLCQCISSGKFSTAFSTAPMPQTAVLLSSSNEVVQVITDPAMRELVNWLLMLAGFAPWIDGPLPFGEVIAAILALVALGILTYYVAKTYIEQITAWVEAYAAMPKPTSPKSVGNNKRANEVARELGFDGAEDLKEAYVEDGAHWDIYIDTKTGQIWLRHKRSGKWKDTGLNINQ